MKCVVMNTPIIPRLCIKVKGSSSMEIATHWSIMPHSSGTVPAIIWEIQMSFMIDFQKLKWFGSMKTQNVIFDIIIYPK